MIQLNKIFCFTVLSFFIQNQLLPGIGDLIANTDNTTKYVKSSHTFFRDAPNHGDLVQGVVRLNDGFAVDNTATASFDTFITVSGGIDLRATGKLVLLSSLYLEPTVTFSVQGGQIDGRGHTIFLEGDLELPDNCVMNIIGDTVIDGNGKELKLGKWAQISVDNNVTLTLRNLSLKNSYTDYTVAPIRPVSYCSQLALDNVDIRLADDFNFDQGQLFIHNDVAFSGTYKFSYNSTKQARITSDSCLYFSPDSIFEYHPSSTINNLIEFEDRSSCLYLDGCTLQTTDTGMRISKGRLFLDNKVTLSTQGYTRLDSVTTLTNIDYGTTDAEVHTVEWSPDGTYLAFGGNNPTELNTEEIRIYRFDGYRCRFVISKVYGALVRSVSWHPSGKYLAVGGEGPTSDSELQIYRFDGSELTLVTSADFGNSLILTAWRPDGKYLVIGGSPGSSTELRIYSFSDEYIDLVDSADWGAAQVQTVSWTSCGLYLAVGGYTDNAGDELKIYSFNGSNLTLRDSADWVQSGFYIIYEVAWSPNNEYLIVGGTGATFRVYRFNKETTKKLSFLDSGFYSGEVVSLTWLKDGKYFAIGGFGPDNTEIYSFDGSSISSLLFREAFPGTVIQGIRVSPDGQYMAVGGSTATHEHVVIYKLGFGYETTPQAVSRALIFGDSSLGSDHDLDVNILGGSYVVLNGILTDDSA